MTTTPNPNPLSRIQVRASVLSCTACPLHQSCKAPVPFRGPAPAKVAVIGEAPGKVEDTLGKPFVGPSGKLVEKWLTNAGIHKEDVAYLNVVSCYPNRTPQKSEVAACRHNLDAQLSLIAPEYVLVFGGVAVSAWWDIRIGEIRGLWWRGDVNGLDYQPWFMATWHPAAVLRNRDLEKEVVDDVDFFTLSLGELRPSVSLWCVKCKVKEGVVWKNGLTACEKHRKVLGKS